MTKISYIDYYIPDNQYAIRDLVADISDQAIPKSFDSKTAYLQYTEDVLNLSSVRAEQSLSGEEMLLELLEKMIDESGTEVTEIDAVLLAQEPRPGQLKNLGQYLQYRMQINNATIFNVSGNHCSNIEYAVSLGDALLSSRPEFNKILIVAYLKLPNASSRIIGTYGVEGDAAGVMLLNRTHGKINYRGSTSCSNGMLYKAGRDEDYAMLHCKYYIQCLQNLLQQQQLAPDAINHIIIQNANTLLSRQCLEAVGLDTSSIFEKNLSKYGHLDCLDFLVNLKDLADAKLTDSIEHVLAFGTGWAGSYISSHLTIE